VRCKVFLPVCIGKIKWPVLWLTVYLVVITQHGFYRSLLVLSCYKNRHCIVEFIHFHAAALLVELVSKPCAQRETGWQVYL